MPGPPSPRRKFKTLVGSDKPLIPQDYNELVSDLDNVAIDRSGTAEQRNAISGEDLQDGLWFWAYDTGETSRYRTGAGWETVVPKDAPGSVASMRTLGSGAQQAVAGNDTRLSDARTPKASSVSNEHVAADAAIASSKLNIPVDAAVGTAALRTLGANNLQAASGSDKRFLEGKLLASGTSGQGVDTGANQHHAVSAVLGFSMPVSGYAVIKASGLLCREVGAAGLVYYSMTLYCIIDQNGQLTPMQGYNPPSQGEAFTIGGSARVGPLTAGNHNVQLFLGIGNNPVSVRTLGFGTIFIEYSA